jgi:hypothetical protein
MSKVPPPTTAQEIDHVSGRGALAVILVGIAIFGGAVAWSSWLLRREMSNLGVRVVRAVPVLETHANGRLEQTLISSTASGWARRAAQSRVLGRYSWVDKSHGVAHIPIERAIDIVAARGGGP